MYYQRRPTILFRNYGEFGYLTDNRNFGYRRDNPIVGDKVLSQSGAVILESLGKNRMTAEEVADIALNKFIGVDRSSLVYDIIELFEVLVNDGFLMKGGLRDDNTQETRLFNDNHSAHVTTFSCKPHALNNSTQAFFHQHFGDNPFPTSVHLEIAAACNEKCVHCYIPQGIKIGIMPFDMVKSVIKQCTNLNILYITLSGGEPMLHPDFLKILSLCNDNDFSVNVLSNLTNLNEVIVEEMVANPLLSVQASLYSTDEAVHDSITGVPGSCKKTMQSILSLVHHNIPVQISCPIMKQNYNSYREVMNWGKEEGVTVSADYVIIGRCDGTSTNLQCRLQMEEIAAILKEELSEPLSRESLSEEVRNNKMRLQDDFICGVCGSSICVRANGDVFPCAGWENCVLGNINELSLKDIWFNSEKAIGLRSLRRRDFTKCNSCEYEDYCTLCLVRNANENEAADPLIVNDFFCEVAKLKKCVFENKSV